MGSIASRKRTIDEQLASSSRQVSVPLTRRLRRYLQGWRMRIGAGQLRPSVPDDFADSQGGLSTLLVLPNAHCCPTGLGQVGVRCRDPVLDCSRPFPPRMCVRDSDRVMFRASMPEATIQEDRDFGPREARSAVRRKPFIGRAETLYLKPSA